MLGSSPGGKVALNLEGSCRGPLQENVVSSSAEVPTFGFLQSLSLWRVEGELHAWVGGVKGLRRPPLPASPGWESPTHCQILWGDHYSIHITNARELIGGGIKQQVIWSLIMVFHAGG